MQPITGFVTGMIGRAPTVCTRYDRPVSFAIRRCEFDDYLLRRSGARLIMGQPVTGIERNGGMWVLNGQVRAPMLVGAGGHFCPVAHGLNPDARVGGDAPPLVVAQEAEWTVEGSDQRGEALEQVELFFCRDLKGYGWCVRKQQYVNVGLGRLDRRSLPAATAEFLAFLVARGTIGRVGGHWCGHAYSVFSRHHRRVVGDGVLLVGDAAGVASPKSGEGIHQAIESALRAASTILQADGRYDRARLEPYAEKLFAKSESGISERLGSRVTRSPVGLVLGRALLAVPQFVRYVVLDRWFLGSNGQQHPATA